MSAVDAPTASWKATTWYVARIEVHLARFADGHDPLGHLFSIERLARSARSEGRETRRLGEPGRRDELAR